MLYVLCPLRGSVWVSLVWCSVVYSPEHIWVLTNFIFPSSVFILPSSKTTFDLLARSQGEGGAFIEEALKILSEFARHALLREVDIDNERHIVMEEWRLSLSAQSRMWARMQSAWWSGTKYVSHIVCLF
jgi:hypothetical protein